MCLDADEAQRNLSKGEKEMERVLALQALSEFADQQDPVNPPASGESIGCSSASGAGGSGCSIGCKESEELDW